MNPSLEKRFELIIRDNLEEFIKATLVKSDKTGRFFIVSSVASHLRTIIFSADENGMVLSPSYYKEPGPITHEQTVAKWSRGEGEESALPLQK